VQLLGDAAEEEEIDWGHLKTGERSIDYSSGCRERQKPAKAGFLRRFQVQRTQNDSGIEKGKLSDNTGIHRFHHYLSGRHGP
jgi:hypothetical protein